MTKACHARQTIRPMPEGGTFQRDALDATKRAE